MTISGVRSDLLAHSVMQVPSSVSAKKAGAVRQQGAQRNEPTFGTPVTFSKYVTTPLSKDDLRDMTKRAVSGAEAEFISRFVGEFSGENGSKLKAALDKGQLENFTARLDDRLRAKDHDGVRAVVKEFLGTLGRSVSGKMREFGEDSGWTLQDNLIDEFNSLAFNETELATAENTNGDNVLQGHMAEVKVGEDTLSGVMNEDGLTVSSDGFGSVPPGRVPRSAEKLVEGLVQETKDAYDKRLQTMFGSGTAPGIEQAIDAVVDNLDPMLRNAYQNGYSENGESVMDSTVRLFAGALFGNEGLDSIEERLKLARKQAGDKATAALKMGDADPQQVYADTFAELTEGIPQLGRVFSRGAAQGVGVTDALFQGLDDRFLGNLLDRVGERSLVQVRTIETTGQHYSNDDLERMKQAGRMLEQTV